jgi:nucleoside-diphosphate-sugar epimerase
VRVLVTGGTGFLGRGLVPALRHGHDVRVTSRKPSDGFVVQPALEDDRADWSPLLAGIDAVVHLAGIAHATEAIADERYDQVNHLGTLRLARACEQAGVKRFVFVSSIRAQTGPTHDGVLTEQSPAMPTDAYGRSKLAAELALATTRLDYTILRPVLVYGAGLKGNLAQLAKLARLPLPLPLGGLSNRRSLLSRDGLDAAIDVALTDANAVRKTFIVADASPVSVAEIIAAFRRGAGRSPGLLRVPRRVLGALVKSVGGAAMWNRLAGDLVADSAKLASLGWKPRQTIDGLERLARAQ